MDDMFSPLSGYPDIYAKRHRIRRAMQKNLLSEVTNNSKIRSTKKRAKQVSRNKLHESILSHFKDPPNQGAKSVKDNARDSAIQRKINKKAEKKRRQQARHKFFDFVRKHWIRKQKHRKNDVKSQAQALRQRYMLDKEIHGNSENPEGANLVDSLEHKIEAKQHVPLRGRRILRAKRPEKLLLSKEDHLKLMLKLMWASATKLVKEHISSISSRQQGSHNSWVSMLASLKLLVSKDDKSVETCDILDEAICRAEQEDRVLDDCNDDEQTAAAATSPNFDLTDEKDCVFFGNHTNILYTESVKKWLQGSAGGGYRALFVKRMKQLSNGERSRILAKRLKVASKNFAVFETYLEQKSGKRILWTIKGKDLLVWYVASHDNVSRLVKHIGNSQDRNHRRLFSNDDLAMEDSQPQSDDLNSRKAIKYDAILDPFGNTPMKVFEVSVDSIDEMASESWVPRLRLTKEERDIVETRGTVLLLGRSGTGKTVCIAS